MSAFQSVRIFSSRAGPDAQRAYGEQLRAGRVDQLGARPRRLERGADTEMPAALEVGGLIEPEAAREHARYSASLNRSRTSAVVQT